MSGGLEVRLPWGDGEYAFRLTVGGWRRVQEKCDAGPEEIAARLAPTVSALRAIVKDATAEDGQRHMTFLEGVLSGLIGRWRVDDVREVLFQGLLGGGNDPQLTARLMAMVDDRPLQESVPLAFAVVMASIAGVPGDPVGEDAGEIETPPFSPDPKSSSAGYSAPAAERDSRPRKSRK